MKICKRTFCIKNLSNISIKTPFIKSQLFNDKVLIVTFKERYCHLCVHIKYTLSTSLKMTYLGTLYKSFSYV